MHIDGFIVMVIALYYCLHSAMHLMVRRMAYVVARNIWKLGEGGSEKVEKINKLCIKIMYASGSGAMLNHNITCV